MQRVFFVVLTLAFSQLAIAENGSKTVERFIEAFNKHDADAMLAQASSDSRWMSIAGQKLSTETSTHEELRSAMTGYFESIPSARSEVRSIKESGPFVYTLEEAFWLSNGTEKSQCSVAVYELSENKIKNVWYFPAHNC
ncbi:nuclear transport factor 2 family protein [Alteromonadaceae bacterium M269]|nr:nuclear transport factor 2 family protein [Alteromonadaceae bacterium M269]